MEGIDTPVVGAILNTVLGVMRLGVIEFLIKNLLILLIVLYATLKVYLTMLFTYIKLFMNVILGPIQILIGSFPGNFFTVTNWLKSVFANVLVFVGIFIVVNLEHPLNKLDINFILFNLQSCSK